MPLGVATDRLGLFEIASPPTNGSDEVQTITFGGSPVAQPFRLGFRGRNTSDITWSGTNATLVTRVLAALVALPEIKTGNVTVAVGTMTAGVGTLLVTYVNAQGKRAQQNLTVPLNTTGGTIAVTKTTPGVTATLRGKTSGALAINTTTKIVYQNAGTRDAPIWTPLTAITSQAVGSPAVASTTGVHAAVTDTGLEQIITTGITNPAVPRNITATSGGTAGDIADVQVIIDGTDINDVAITETLPIFTENSATTVLGSKAFKTVTSIVLPAMDGTGATVAVGFGTKLGLSKPLSRDTVLNTFHNGGRETTRPTVAFDAANVSGNTVILNATLNGSAVIVDFYQ